MRKVSDEKLMRVKAFVFDVDRVFTDVGILGTETGALYRYYDSKDGFGVRMASLNGYGLAIITGGRSLSILERARRMGFRDEDVYLHSRNKIEDFEDFLKRHDLAPEEVMYFGDDVPDLCIMQLSGVISVCPADAVQDLLDYCDWVSEDKGGKRFVRNVVEYVMKLQGRWNFKVDDYKKNF